MFCGRDRSNGSPNLKDIRLAQLLIRDFHLVEPPSFGKHFTWTMCQSNLNQKITPLFHVHSILNKHDAWWKIFLILSRNGGSLCNSKVVEPSYFQRRSLESKNISSTGKILILARLNLRSWLYFMKLTVVRNPMLSLRWSLPKTPL